MVIAVKRVGGLRGLGPEVCDVRENTLASFSPPSGEVGDAGTSILSTKENSKERRGVEEIGSYPTRRRSRRSKVLAAWRSLRRVFQEVWACRNAGGEGLTNEFGHASVSIE